MLNVAVYLKPEDSLLGFHRPDSHKGNRGCHGVRNVACKLDASLPFHTDFIMFLSILPLLFTLIGCDFTPSYVDGSDINDALALNRFKTVCKGLEMEDDEIRRYATESLINVDDPIAQECICANVAHPTKMWDPAIAAGLKGTERDELVQCFADLVLQPALPKRLEAVTALALIPAKSAREASATIAAEASTDVEIRVRAVGSISGNPDYEEVLVGLLKNDKEPTVRAAAAKGLSPFKKSKTTKEALAASLDSDEEGVVRAAALVSLKKTGVRNADELVCKAMMEDPAEEVRTAAVGTYQGTKRSNAVKCLRDRTLTFEESASVRMRLLEVLKSSPHKDVPDILCDAIPFWMRSYVKEDIPEKVPGTMIVEAQNDRDWENSFDCLKRAYRNSSGYSCFAKMHVALWFREVGGNTYVPNCPGYEHPSLTGD